jgi:hypothetical protein
LSLSLDIRRLHRRGLMHAGSSFGWRWNYDGEPCGNIGVYVRVSDVELSYTRTPNGGTPQHMRYDVPLDWTRCHLGGSRQWFRCPWCHQRCAILYGLSSDGYFGCRLCLRLGYASEAEDTGGRLWRKQRKLEAKLNEDGGKPKWMRGRTFEHIYERIDAVEEARDQDFLFGAARLLRRLGVNLDEPSA